MMKKTYLIVVLLLLVGGTGLYAFQSPPTVTITPAVPSTVYVNSTTTVTIAAEITDSRVIATGVNLIQVDPITGAQTVAGTLASQGAGLFNITIQPNTSAPRLFSYEVSAPFLGFLKRSISPPITVAVAPIGAILPPDPGPAGMATLAGVDSDHNGVRDDVQRWIVVVAAPTSSDLQQALFQDAIGIQEFLLATSSSALATANNDSDKATQCLFDVGKLLNQSPTAIYQLSQELVAQYTNTDSRVQAFLQANTNSNGSIGSGINLGAQLGLTCSFDISSLER